MKALFKSRLGVLLVLGFGLLMTVVATHVAQQRRARGAGRTAVRAANDKVGRSPAEIQPQPSPGESLAQTAAYLEPYYDSDRRTHEVRDSLGNGFTRRDNPDSLGQRPATITEENVATVIVPARSSSRLAGRPAAGPVLHPGPPAVPPPPTAPARPEPAPGRPKPKPSDPSAPAPDGAHAQGADRPTRFNPYGRVIKCELVFTIDSTNEGAPLVGLVMEPVYNNGVLVIPAGAEIHGTARPDRLRDRIFSSTEWVLVLPREDRRPNGRQLTVRGVALDRVEPDANGMTWGITDGSYGLQGQIIRTMDAAEIKRFAATFLAEAAVALQSKQQDAIGQDVARSSPQNALLQGAGADLQAYASDIAREVAKNGVFIRVPAGHQFYFYPMQIIDPDRADISSDIATVK